MKQINPMLLRVRKLKLQRLQADADYLYERKAHYVYIQHFEKAAACRDKEKVAIQKLENFKEMFGM